MTRNEFRKIVTAKPYEDHDVEIGNRYVGEYVSGQFCEVRPNGVVGLAIKRLGRGDAAQRRNTVGVLRSLRGLRTLP